MANEFAYYQKLKESQQTDSPKFMMDNGVFMNGTELYTDVKDFEKEAAVEATLRANGLTWNKEETFIDSEQMHETIYTTEVLINA